MIDNKVWILLAAAVALGWVSGQQVRRRKDAEAMAAELRRHLPLAGASDRQLKEIRGVLNDTHKRILAVSKLTRSQVHCG